jgi:hypothetical protein
MKTTNYRQTFITASPDSSATRGLEPPKPDSVAGLLHAMLRDAPYGRTSDDLLFEAHARRNGVAEADRVREREIFFAKSQACLRASPLVKQYGWGLHHDDQGRVAAYGVESESYRALASDPGVSVVAGMRSRRS